MKNIIRFLVSLSVVGMVGCETAYYGAMEQVGIHKRDIMVGRVEDVRESQVDVKEQFTSALERFSTELNFDGGDLEKTYKLLNEEYEDSKTEAESLSADIDGVENVADALFDEWEQELNQYSSAALRRDSERQLHDTRRQYTRMLRSMRNAESKMTPVLNRLSDQVLYLKHNLNARAIASVETEFGSLKSDIRVLISEMEVSIAEADKFIAALK